MTNRIYTFGVKFTLGEDELIKHIEQKLYANEAFRKAPTQKAFVKYLRGGYENSGNGFRVGLVDDGSVKLRFLEDARKLFNEWFNS